MRVAAGEEFPGDPGAVHGSGAAVRPGEAFGRRDDPSRFGPRNIPGDFLLNAFLFSLLTRWFFLLVPPAKSVLRGVLFRAIKDGWTWFLL